MAKTAVQQDIPGAGRPRIKAIDDKAIEYRDVRDQRMDLTKQEATLHGELLALMEKHRDDLEKNADGYPVYVIEGDTHEAVLQPPGGPKVKVRKRKEATEDE